MRGIGIALRSNSSARNTLLVQRRIESGSSITGIPCARARVAIRKVKFSTDVVARSSSASYSPTVARSSGPITSHATSTRAAARAKRRSAAASEGGVGSAGSATIPSR